MNRFAYWSVVVGFFLLANSSRAEPESPRGGKAAERNASIEKQLDAFQLRLIYYGEQGKPFYNLTLSVPPIAPLDENPFQPVVQIDREQAGRLVRQLRKDGFWQRAAPLGEATERSAASGYFLSVSGKDVAWQEDLGWDLAMLKRLDNLEDALDGKAAESMQLLLGRLSGYRRLWEAQQAAKP